MCVCVCVCDTFWCFILMPNVFAKKTQCMLLFLDYGGFSLLKNFINH